VVKEVRTSIAQQVTVWCLSVCFHSLLTYGYHITLDIFKWSLNLLLVTFPSKIIAMSDEIFTDRHVRLTAHDVAQLEKQNSRLVDGFKAEMLERNAQKNWDLFYKRNETRFFKDRHWTTREFAELIGHTDERRTLLEIGCGVGNLVYPLVEEGMNFYFYACDFSPRAVTLFKEHPSYDPDRMCAFQTDVTKEELTDHIKANSVDVVTLVFVLSAIHPEKFETVLRNVKNVLKPGGIVLLRDYGLNDMAQIRFKPGHKIAENLYMRQDGTR